MHIAIDIDDTITHAPEFFRAMTHALEGAEVSIVSFRDDEAEARRLLEELQIRFDRIVLPHHAELGRDADQSLSEWKAGVVNTLAADVFFEDMPEIVHLVTPPTKVFLCCDTFMREWLADQVGTT